MAGPHSHLVGRSYTDKGRARYLSPSYRCYPYAEKTTAITGNLIGPDNADISRADSLTNFINWAAKTCPARKYILIMSDHGGGYLPHAELPSADAAAARQTRGVIYDNGHNGAHFTAKTLAQAISQASVRPSVV